MASVTGKLLYFAFGSNLSHEQMAARCPAAEPVCPAQLLGYRLVFAGDDERWGGGVADIRPDSQWYVQGGVYRMRKKDLLSLDVFEGHPSYYERFKVEIIIPPYEKNIAWTYRMKEKFRRTKPSRSYLETIIKGFFDFKLPPPPEVSAAEYVE